MSTLIIELPEHTDQKAFNEHRWAELVVDPTFSKFEGKVETDRHGQVIMSPPPTAKHVRYQNRITFLLQTLLPDGEALTDCPISTADGVRVADSAWLSKPTMAELGNRSCFPVAPEICVEVRSPDNSEKAMQEKAALYLDAGAREVWLCDKFGRLSFFDSAKGKAMSASKFCPLFPTQIRLD